MLPLYSMMPDAPYGFSEPTIFMYLTGLFITIMYPYRILAFFFSERLPRQSLFGTCLNMVYNGQPVLALTPTAGLFLHRMTL